ncbi:efflux RND transporter permease subunit, partial [Rhizobium brockwellii]|uniref:efflux RND transporter permease subunit n=1 Tax=Rhizobium brockwellii TaxID=3019932 RepID=UPI003F967356
ANAITSEDVVYSFRDQNVQMSGAKIGAPPVTRKNAYQYTLRPDGRFSDVREFRYVIVKSTTSGRLVQLQDVARIELGSQDYVTNSYLHNDPAVALG